MLKSYVERKLYYEAQVMAEILDLMMGGDKHVVCVFRYR